MENLGSTIDIIVFLWIISQTKMQHNTDFSQRIFPVNWTFLKMIIDYLPK